MSDMLDKTAYRKELVAAIGRRQRRMRRAGAAAAALGVLTVVVSVAWLTQIEPNGETRVVSPPDPEAAFLPDAPDSFEFDAGRSEVVLIGRGGTRGPHPDGSYVVGGLGVTVTEVHRGTTHAYPDVASVVYDIARPGALVAQGSLPELFAWRDGLLFWPFGSRQLGPSNLVVIPLDSTSGDEHGQLRLGEAQSVAEVEGSGRGLPTASGAGMWVTLSDYENSQHTLYWLEAGADMVQVVAPGPARLVGVAGEDAVLHLRPPANESSRSWSITGPDGVQEHLDPPPGIWFLGGTDRHLVWFGSEDAPHSGTEVVIQDRTTGELTVVASPGDVQWGHVSPTTTTTSAGPLPHFSRNGEMVVLGLVPPDSAGRGSRFGIIELATGEIQMIDVPTQYVESVFWGGNDTLLAIVRESVGGRQAVLEIDASTGHSRSLGHVTPRGVSIVAAAFSAQ